MTCKICGTNDPYDALQCSNCGADLVAADQELFAMANSGAATPPSGGAEEYYEAAVGHKNAAYYLPRFARFDAEGIGASWNWPAFWFSLYWLVYRKMWLWALTYVLLPIPFGFLSLLSQPAAIAGYGVYLAAIYIAFPMYANALYYAHVNKKIQQAKAHSAERNKQLQRLAASGGTSMAAWIILLVLTIAIVGTLAAITIPAYQNYLQ